VSRKYIFISGGVISGLGKGIITSSLSLLLRDAGFTVAPVKIDMYLNMDAGTLRPQEHGETFVLESGMETDQDLGNYERFLNVSLPRENYITTGQIYAEVIRKERAFAYGGEDVEAIPHVTDEITRRIREAGRIGKADIVLIELGGTVTLQEVQNRVFIEAARLMKLNNPRDVVHVHVTYLPFVKSIGELKSKPAYTSVYILNSMGIQPDLIFARSEVPLDRKRADRVALFCNVHPDDLILSPDVPSIYSVPEVLAGQRTTEKICRKLGLRKRKNGALLLHWREVAARIAHPPKAVTVGIAAKYYTSGDYALPDAYVSVLEALRHAGGKIGVKVDVQWLNAVEFERQTRREIREALRGLGGLIVPQGWGSRGVEGKIKVVQYAREHRIPYLGLCFGMQMAVIEYARNVLGMKDANSTEVNPKTLHPVIHIMPNQAEYLARRQYGGTMRLGSWPCVIKHGSVLEGVYTASGDGEHAPWFQAAERKRQFPEKTNDGLAVFERHRHRFEFNNDFRQQFETEGMKIAGTSPDGSLVEAIELPDHPFFIGTQFHPEYQSRPLAPHPLFVAFLTAATKHQERTAH
jgi:CTP synthase